MPDTGPPACSLRPQPQQFATLVVKFGGSVQEHASEAVTGPIAGAGTTCTVNGKELLQPGAKRVSEQL